jgi:hypothetical protein
MMVEELLDDTKFIVIPRQLADQLRVMTARLGYSVTDFAVEALTQAMRAQELGSDLKDAVDMYRLTDVQKGAGNMQVTRTVFKEVLQRLYESDGDELHRLWYDHGKWYGAYLKARLGRDQVLDFMEKDLLVTWNLDEAKVVQKDLMVSVRCVSFGMSKEFTELMVSYIQGLLEELGFTENERDVLRGLVSMKFLGKLK